MCMVPVLWKVVVSCLYTSLSYNVSICIHYTGIEIHAPRAHLPLAALFLLLLGSWQCHEETFDIPGQACELYS